jgi:DNA gyrase subunit A
MGNITIKTSDRNGAVVGAKLAGENDEIMIITDHGQIIRTRVSEISIIGRNTQGVRIMNTNDDERIVSFARIREEDLREDSEAEEDDAPPSELDQAQVETVELSRSEEEE